jgi:hypothetical protein
MEREGGQLVVILLFVRSTCAEKSPRGHIRTHERWSSQQSVVQRFSFGPP